MKRRALFPALVLVCGAVLPAAALSGREVIDTAQKKNGFPVRTSAAKSPRSSSSSARSSEASAVRPKKVGFV